MHEYAYRCLPSLYFSTTHFPLSADSDEKFGRRLRRPISSWITPLFFHALVKRFHNTHVSFSKRSLKGRRRKTPTISFDFQLYDFVFFFFSANPSVRIVDIDAMRARVQRLRLRRYFSFGRGVTRAIDRENYATPATLVSVKSSERAAPWHGWKNFEGHTRISRSLRIDRSNVFLLPLL